MLNPLLDRESQLDRLNEAWEAARGGRSQLVLLWGRRRVGKTFLLSHLVQEKRSVFFAATRQGEARELARLHESVRRDLGEHTGDLAGGSFASWEAALKFFSALAAEEPLLVVLDEVPYLAESTEGFPSIVQAVWDHLPSGRHLMLVLTGSAVSTIEEMIDAGAALRGRPTVTMRLDPLSPLQARVFLPDLDPPAFFEAYAACGGYPLHLQAWRESSSTPTNLRNLAGTPGGILLEDARGILDEELASSRSYGRVLAAIGRGRTRYSEIAGEAEQRVEYPLKVLGRAGLVVRETPVGAPRGASPTYRIDDTYLAFWFRVLYQDMGLIEGGQGEAVLSGARGRWQDHLGWTFEALARDHARRLVEAGDLPSDLVVGRWWADRGEPCEVDVLGLSQRRTALMGEARWRARPLGVKDLRRLQAKTARVPRPRDELLYRLWSRNGVTEAVEGAGALGYSLADMLGASAPS